MLMPGEPQGGHDGSPFGERVRVSTEPAEAMRGYEFDIATAKTAPSMAVGGYGSGSPAMEVTIPSAIGAERIPDLQQRPRSLRMND